MKKIIRFLGISLVLVSSCTKEDNVDNISPEATPSRLVGTYNVSIAIVATAVDTNKDAVFNQDLLLEGYKCFSNKTYVITEKKFSIMTKAGNCNATDINEDYDYKLNQDSKTLDLYKNGAIIETLDDIRLGVNSIKYEKYDSFLKQTVAFKLTKI